ncbi:MAG: lipid carrier--UDP-N-acetylgalactosaminyltransferase [Chryseobacterium sp. 39-10]|nr:sugar transferase [Chryseobacterium sp.]OJV47999.1 MAG: lipid carrier--UDP-N-acetylgalactosaminyltransferase [Chryseobacterium sp. 39-10]
MDVAHLEVRQGSLSTVYENVVKPGFDFLFALVALVLLSPIFLMILLTLTIANSGHPFFIQERPGKNGKIFRIIKFKTMTNKKDAEGQLLPDYRRLTLIGKAVRKTSLDEIPQLINVLKGDMSLVGPRPLLPEYLPLYNDFQKQRHLVKPGITGWAQVNGRNALSWDEKFRYDVEYVSRISLQLDLRIIFTTLEKIVKRHGVNANNYMTMEAFKGNAA